MNPLTTQWRWNYRLFPQTFLTLPWWCWGRGAGVPYLVSMEHPLHICWCRYVWSPNCLLWCLGTIERSCPKVFCFARLTLVLQLLSRFYFSFDCILFVCTSCHFQVLAYSACKSLGYMMWKECLENTLLWFFWQLMLSLWSWGPSQSVFLSTLESLLLYVLHIIHKILIVHTGRNRELYVYFFFLEICF